MPQAILADKPGDDPKLVCFRLAPKLHKKLKQKAVQQERTLQDLFAEALQRYLETQ